MAFSHSILRVLCAFTFLLALADALKFDIMAYPAHDKKNTRCIRNFVSKDTLVMVKSTLDGQKGDGMQVNIHIKDAVGNDYARAKDVVGEKRMAFTSLADAAFDVCFENILISSKPLTAPDKYGGMPNLLRKESATQPHVRHVELDVDIGADAKDWSKIQATEKLKPVEIELRRVEELVGEIVMEMEYLRHREQRLRDTNESTNNRVKWFGFGTIGMLCALGAWQIVYLRAYFRSKHLI